MNSKNEKDILKNLLNKRYYFNVDKMNIVIALESLLSKSNNANEFLEHYDTTGKNYDFDELEEGEIFLILRNQILLQKKEKELELKDELLKLYKEKVESLWEEDVILLREKIKEIELKIQRIPGE